MYETKNSHTFIFKKEHFLSSLATGTGVLTVVQEVTVET
jgi:hypothetical protein